MPFYEKMAEIFSGLVQTRLLPKLPGWVADCIRNEPGVSGALRAVSEEALSGTRSELKQGFVRDQEAFFMLMRTTLERSRRCSNRATWRKALAFVRHTRSLAHLMALAFRWFIPACLALILVASVSTAVLRLRDNWQSAELDRMRRLSLSLEAENRELNQSLSIQRQRAETLNRLNLRLFPDGEIWAQVPSSQWPQITEQDQRQSSWIMLKTLNP